MPVRDLLIVGAGPSGLSAAIAAKQRGLDYQVIEQGALVNSIYHFPPQMVFFTTPDLLEIGGLPFVSPYEKPTRAEALKYYRKVVDAFDLQIAFEEQALSIARETEPGEGPVFAVETRSTDGVRPAALRHAQGRPEHRRGTAGSGRSEQVEGRRVRLARHVVLAIGYYDHPNLVGVPGEDLPHVHHYYGEPHPFYRQRVVIVGGGNSAAEAALELHRAGAHVTIVHRRGELKSTIKYWVKPDIENRIKAGSIAARFDSCVIEIRPTSVFITGPGPATDTRARLFDELSVDPSIVEGRESTLATEQLPADAVFLLTGYHPDWTLLAEAGVTIDDRGVPDHNPDTLETNVPGLFVAGGVIAGKDTAPIFIENGRFHGERIVETISARGSSPLDTAR